MPLVIAALTFILSACIENDIPYPKIQPNFTAFEVENQLRQSVIDSASRTVTVYLNEAADIQHLKVLNWGVTSNAIFPDSTKIEGYINLQTPMEVTMSVYQDYVWTIRAVQDIERYFTIANQVGSSDIDVDSRTVFARVPMQQPLTDIEVKTLKLAGTTATYDPELAGHAVDFTNPVKVTVNEFGRSSEWTLTVEQTDVNVDLTAVDAWTCVAWLYGEAEAGKNNGFEYRLASVEDWTEVPSQWISHDGGSFTARLVNLIPETEYVVRACSDADHSIERRFTTGSILQLPNSTFTDWWLDGKVWCPWKQDGDPFWGTGNKGATTLGSSNTVPVDDLLSPTSYAGAKLQSKFVGISVLGKLASGNLFAGTYVRTVGTNGILDFGRPFTQRPTRLTAKITYSNVNITHASSSNPDFRSMIGQPDTCIVWCSLIDSDEPFEIRTDPKDRHLFDRNGDEVIAYGEFTSGEPIEEYREITVDLDYKSTSRVPKYILVTASASKYGDYFTGGNGSVLCIKEFTLHYDY